MSAWVGSMGSQIWLVPDLAVPLDDFRRRGGQIERRAPAHVLPVSELRQVQAAELEPKPKRKRKAVA